MWSAAAALAQIGMACLVAAFFIHEWRRSNVRHRAWEEDRRRGRQQAEQAHSALLAQLTTPVTVNVSPRECPRCHMPLSVGPDAPTHDA